MDSQWEFDCPQFVDFSEPRAVNDDDEADRFFDTETNLENIGAIPPELEQEQEEADPVFETPVGKLEKIKTQFRTQKDQEKSVKEPEVAKQVETEAKEEKTEEKNAEEQSSEDAKDDQEDAKTPRRSSRITSNESQESPAEEPKQSTKTPSNPRRIRTRSTPFRGTPSAKNSAKKTGLYGRAERIRSASCDRPTATSSQEDAESSRSEEESSALRVNPPNMKPKLAQMSPSVLRKRLATTMKAGAASAASNNAKFTKSSEEMELERIQKMRDDLERQKKQFKQTFQKAMIAAGTQAVRSKMPATRPQEFTFTSDQRLKSHERSKSTGLEPPEFSRTLRSTSAVAVPESVHDQEPKIKPKVTMPQPFNLSQNRKRKSAMSDSTEPLKACEKFKSVAEQVKDFAKKTPDRFRTSRRSGGPSPAKQGKVEKPKLTIPKTPNFQTKTRLRPVTVMSQEEMEEKELEEFKKHKFKANPVNEKILSSTHIGVKPVAPKEPTVPIGFDFGTEKRKDISASDSSMEQEEKYEFHARPVPKSVLCPLPMKPLKLIAPTVPESPAFALKNRLRPKPPTPEIKEKKRTSFRPLPCPGIPFAPVLEHRVTEIEPFSFEQRTEEIKKRKEYLIHQKEEEDKQCVLQAREFHANPMPDLSSPDHLPAVPRKIATIPEPFDLSADVRGAKRAEEWACKMQEEMRKQREMATFHAKPVIVTKIKPFEPKRSSKPVTDITDFELNTQRRAQDRQEFERWKMDKEQEEAEMLRQKEREQEQIEIEEAERMRQEATFKASSVRHYRPVELRASTKSLTVPTTPRFSERLRTRSMRM